MPNKKKSSKKKDKVKVKNINADNLEALKRLATALASLDDKGTSTVDLSVDESNTGLSLFHWRELNDEVEHVYKMLKEGAELIKATSTKYTLVGKINVEDGSRFSEELRQGCELISTAALMVHQPTLGCSRSLRKYTKHHARSVVNSVVSLVDSFVSTRALEKTVGAQKTGVVWSACDDVIAKLPKGNRACMRREIFTWVGDCNETMQEFQEVVDLGPASVEKTVENESSPMDDFEETQYANNGELETAKACLAIVKCSRGVLGLVLKACECAGNEAEKTKEKESDHFKAILQWISNAHELSRKVGENATELGVLLYPPINIEIADSESDQHDKEGKWSRTEIGKQILMQTEAIKAVASYVHDHIVPGDDHIPIPMSDEIMELASKLLSAVDLRKTEANQALTEMIEYK